MFATQAYINPNVDLIHVTTFDILGAFVVLFGVNFIVLLSWQLVAPLEWTRVDRDSTDIFDRTVESYGICTNDGALPFVVVIVVMNIGILIVANWWAYLARNIETEYHESRYIGIAMASILQAWGMGIPILIVVWDNPQAKFFVEAGIIFVTAVAVQLLIFIPKILAVRVDRSLDAEEKQRQASATSSSQDRKGGDFVEQLGVQSDGDYEESMRNDSELCRTSPEVADAASADAGDEPIEEAHSVESMPIDENTIPAPIESPSTCTSKRSSLRGSFVDSISKSMRFSSGALAMRGEGSEASIGEAFGGIRVTHNPRVSYSEATCIFPCHAF